METNIVLFVSAMVISFVTCFVIANKKGHFKKDKFAVIGIATLCGFISFAFYIALNIIVTSLTDVSKNVWLVLPATLIIVWQFYGNLFNKFTSKNT